MFPCFRDYTYLHIRIHVVTVSVSVSVLHNSCLTCYVTKKSCFTFTKKVIQLFIKTQSWVAFCDHVFGFLVPAVFPVLSIHIRILQFSEWLLLLLPCFLPFRFPFLPPNNGISNPHALRFVLLQLQPRKLAS